ncbi:MAG: signal peptidase I [Planctomycetota bacterium]
MKAAEKPVDLWVSEQVEALAIAVAMALVLKFFVIEAFQIPTGSMQPTILGDATAGIKDRVLADKLCTMLRDPRRWEVMIFRFPYDERRLYIKRIVGLPGEVLEIAGGDVWIDGRIARKPDHVNDSVLKAIYPVRDGSMDLGRAFLASEGITLDAERAVFATDASGELRLRETVHDDYLDGYDPSWGIQPGATTRQAVPDLEVTLTALLERPDGVLTITLSSDEGETIFSLGGPQAAAAPLAEFRSAQGGAPVLRLPAGEQRLPVGEEVEIVARDVDRQLTLFVDGDEWGRAADDTSGPRRDDTSRSMLALALRGGGSVHDVVVRRDIYYLPRQAPSATDPRARWEIPNDSYFALGDNTQGSLDSRQWEQQTYVLRDRSVSGFWLPGQPFSSLPPDRNPRVEPSGDYVFADTHGDEFRFSDADIVSQRREPAPFIHRRYLLGKALVVFWPVFDPFRWKLIR